jgi:sugar lactone lactonase YvrE/enterochelin esterase-like enzyme
MTTHRWLLNTLALCGATALVAAEDAAKPAAVPQGKVTKYGFAGSKVFPGTVRDYWVYVPAQYDGATPACVYVNQDGMQWNAPAVFDRLIAAKEMPVTIAIGVMHGRVPAPNAEALDRFNRSFEYDGLGDGYARFLLDELLPHIEKEQGLKLSHGGNDRAIGGSSSGAVCAFTAAWERPDAFTRVFSAIGTYVGLRGANDYPILVRKVEPKPLRVFLQDGSNDLNIYCGDWWMANQEMERSLVFAGYEVNHAWGDGKHEGKHGTEVFPEAMKWLWQGWPEPVKAGKGSPQMQDVLLPGESWQLVGEGYKFTEGPAVNAKGEVFFTDIPNSVVWKIGADGKPVEWLKETQKGNGLRFGPDGRAFLLAMDAKEVWAIDEGGKKTVHHAGFRGNDLVVLKNGAIYATEPGWDGVAPGKVWYISPTGEGKVVDDQGLKFVNGVVASPDQSLLYVVDSKTHWVFSYQIQPDGTLAHRQKYYHLHVPDSAEDAWGDGMRVDTAGRLYVATRMGIQFCDQAGRVNGIIPTPNGKVSNLTFGGPELDTIYATCGDKVFKRKVKAKGVEGMNAPVKPEKPRL